MALEDRIRKIKCVTVIGLAALVAQHYKNKGRRRRSFGVRNRIEKRNTNNIGSVSLVHDELASEDPFPYKNYLGMDKHTFLKLLYVMKPHIDKNETNIRLSITARDSLIVTLRFLTTGESYQDIMYSTRIPATTLSKIIPDCCEVIHNVLKDKYLKVPSSEDEWNNIADEFLNKCNIPNCIGALDGKHVEFESSMQSNSLILLALIDANYKFIYVRAEKNGKYFKDSNLNTALYKNTLQIPPAKPLPGCVTPVPYVIVADGTFPLQKHLMKPFPKRSSTMEQATYNYRISRAHKIVENGFGILSNRFRIFLTRIKLNPDKVETIILACCALHNFLKDESPDYITAELVDREDDEGNLVLGSWRNDVTQMRTVAFQYGRPSIPVLEIRNEFKKYFNGIGRLPWQNNVNEQYY